MKPIVSRAIANIETADQDGEAFIAVSFGMDDARRPECFRLQTNLNDEAVVQALLRLVLDHYSQPTLQ